MSNSTTPSIDALATRKAPQSQSHHNDPDSGGRRIARSTCAKLAPHLAPAALAEVVLGYRKVRRARNDPVAFAEFAFTDETGKPMKLPQLHRDLHEFLSNNSRALVELPRDHGKTVQIMIRIIWEIGRNPNLRVVLASGSTALAAQRGKFIRDAIAENPRIRMVFPHLVPDRPWRVTTFRVKRSGQSVSPTVVVMGVGATATGARADLLVCDDVVDLKSLRSETIRDKTKQVFRETLINLLEPGGRAWLLFTPWHAADLNAELKLSPIYGQFRRAVGDDLSPIWPEKWPRERLAERRAEIGEASFSRAFRLQTIAEDDCLIQPKWVNYWEGEPPPRDSNGLDLVVLAVDPAVSERKTADASALVTLGRTEDGHVHCLEAVHGRVRAPNLIQMIDAAEQRWKPDIILFESNAAFKGIKDLMTQHARFGSKVRDVNNSGHKFARMHSFSVRVENAKFLLHGEGGSVDPGQQALLDEMLAFPVGKHDDLIDAAAFGTAYLLDTPEPRVRIL